VGSDGGSSNRGVRSTGGVDSGIAIIFSVGRTAVCTKFGAIGLCPVRVGVRPIGGWVLIGLRGML
jgi:hypothetical protein